MSGTSMNLAVNNLTQVERLGSKTRVHTLAIIKPSLDQRQHVSLLLASQNLYREIAYPLIPGEQAVSTEPSTTTLETSNLHPPGLSKPLTRPDPSDSPASSEVPSEPLQNSSHLASQNVPQNMATAPENDSVQSQSSDRDQKATRTFAILNMKQGQNPWDLGSLLLNWETVMGSSVIDWVLPIKRSPCCNHEDAESQFEIGPSVDLLKASVGFMAPEDMRAYGGRRKSERKPVRDSQHDSEQRKHRRRLFRRKNNTEDSQQAPVPLEDFGRQNPQDSV
jgi:palmitoyltransferase